MVFRLILSRFLNLLSIIVTNLQQSVHSRSSTEQHFRNFNFFMSGSSSEIFSESIKETLYKVVERSYTFPDMVCVRISNETLHGKIPQAW